jgi:nicotinate-nucleotide--dimethylbenzimidazole phosphoribosyltransferase
LVLGGARSGKSGYAEKLLGAAPAVYVATARQDPDDPEWAARILRHVARRPRSWSTVEPAEPGALVELLRAAVPGPPILIDDLGNWLTGLLDDTGGWDGEPAAARAACGRLVDAIGACRTELVIVSPEAGLGVVPETASGRVFRDELGALNAAVAGRCTDVVLLVAGVPMTLRAPAEPVESAVADEPDAPETVDETAVEPEPPYFQAQDPASPAGFASVTRPDESVRAAALERQDRLTKPAGSLGRLEELGVWVAACQGQCPPLPFTRPRIVIFAGDHGITGRGVSAYPSEVTAQMVTNFLAGGAAINVLAEAAGATVRVVDMSVDAVETPDVAGKFKVRRGSGSIDTEDALTAEEVAAAIAAGKAIADEEVDAGADLLVAGDMGIGNTTPAAVLIAALTGAEPVAVVGRGTGIDDRTWMRKTAAIRDALRRARPVSADPVALLRTVAGADITAMAAFLAQAAVRRTPVILDGLICGAAALVAAELAPGASDWWLAGHRSAEPAHTLVLEQLDLKPLLEFDMRLGEGSGAAAAIPLLSASVRILAEMATFADAGVSGPAG